MKLSNLRFFFLALSISFSAVLNVGAASDLSGLNVFPNPIRVFNGETTATFDNLTPQVKIVIVDMNSHLVREVELDASGSQYVWDLTNDLGSRVASGVYYYFVSNDSGETRRGKLAIVR